MVTWELILFILFILNVKIFSTIKGFFFFLNLFWGRKEQVLSERCWSSSVIVGGGLHCVELGDLKGLLNYVLFSSPIYMPYVENFSEL